MQYEIGISFLCAILYCFTESEAGTFFLGKRNKNFIRGCLVVGVNVMLMLIASLTTYGIVAVAVVQNICNLIWSLNYNIDYKKKVTTFCLLGIFIIATAIFIRTLFYGEYKEHILFIFLVTMEYVSLKICTVLRKCNVVISNIILVFIPMILVGIAISFVYVDIDALYMRIILLISMLLVIMLLVSIYNNIIWSISSELEQGYLVEQNESYKKQIEVIMDSNEKVRSIRHDMKNHTNVVVKMLEAGQTENALIYLKSINEGLDKYSNRVETGNFEFDAILNKKLEEAVENNIEIDYKVALPRGMAIAPMDAAIVIGNLFDNAIRGAKESEVAEPGISTSMTYEKDVLTIRLKNDCKKSVKVVDNVIPVTTKEDKLMHGIGLKNVMKTIKKYDGVMEIDTENGIFNVIVTMYL